ncbi:4Fe-4S dicluster domain-containing protein [Chloroflexota bacterium]
MEKWNLVIDVEKCEDCNNCFLSCKDEYVDNDFLPYSVAQPKHGHSWMNIIRKERGQCPMVDVAYLLIPCMHCDNAPCIKKVEDGAVYKKNNGIVIIDPEKAKGLKDIVDTCPYGAIWWNEEKNVAQKCTLCAHLLDEGWKEPKCVQSCPTGALSIVKVEDSKMAQIIKDENLEVLHPEYKTKPRVYYKNLYRFLKCFIGGSVAIEVADISECADGARVTLFKNSTKIGEAITDNYGDFKFDNLEENSGRYSLEIVCEGYEKKTLEVDLTTSKNVGTILL